MDVRLVMFRANGQRKDFPIINDAAVIGRADTCELRIPLLSVSRRHCELTIAGDKLKVRDLASSNGTYVNNQRVGEEDLHAGDRLVIGPIVFTIQIDGRPEEIHPVKTKAQKLAERARTAPPPARSAPPAPPALQRPEDLHLDIAEELGLGETAIGRITSQETQAGSSIEGDPRSTRESMAQEAEREDGEKKK